LSLAFPGLRLSRPGCPVPDLVEALNCRADGLTQSRSVSGLTPNCPPLLRTAPIRVTGSRRASTANLIARSRSSSGYFLGAATTLTLPRIESLHQTRHGTPRVPGFPGSPVPGFPGSPVPGFPGSPVPGFPGSPVPGFPGSRGLRFPASPRFPVPGSPGSRFRWLSASRPADVSLAGAYYSRG
jgi:hypothetical protein